MKNIFIVVLLLMPLFSMGQLHTYRNFNHLDGLNISGILCVKQDKQGYLWIGTAGSGLIRYDGEFFKEYENKQDVAALHITDIAIDKNETFYLSTLYSGIVKFKNGKYTVIVDNPKILDEILHIELYDEKLLFFTPTCYYSCDKDGKNLVKKKFPERTKIIQLIYTPSGILILTDRGTFLITESKIINIVKYFKNIPPQFNVSFAEYKYNVLTLYDVQNELRFSVNYTRFGNFNEQKCVSNKLNFPKGKVIEKISSNQNYTLLLLNDNSIKSFENKKLKSVTFNSPLSEGTKINNLFKDNQGTIWVGNTYGLGRITVEPFTKINFDPIYSSNLIGFIDLFEYKNVVLSTYNKETFIGTIGKNNSFEKHNFGIYSSIKTTEGYFVGTNEGLKRLNSSKKFETISTPFKITDKLMVLCFDGTYLYCGNNGDGLYSYHLKSKIWKKIICSSFTKPNYYYTAQINFSNDLIYFGTSVGIHQYQIKKQKLSIKYLGKDMGSYVGNSTKDKYGTLWFTYDYGLLGITKSNEFVYLTDDKLFKSKLFYTLTSDSYGNLIVGTNKGISMIRVSSQGRVTSVKNYDSKSGFSGYETNMRASLQLGNIGYVGTIEGLFQINSDLLENRPVPQNLVILKGRESKNGDLISDQNTIFFTFKSILSLNQNTLYSYRIKGIKDEWSDYSEISELEIENNISSGSYTLEVQASFDKVNHSRIVQKKFTINQPIWKSKWFLFFIVLAIGLVNIFIFDSRKRNSKTQLIDPTEISVESQIAIRLILSTTVITMICGVTLYIVDPKSVSIHFVNLLFFLFQALLSLNGLINLKKNNNKLINQHLIISCYTALFHFYLLTFLSNIEIYSLVAILILNSALPYVFSKIKSAVVFGVIEMVLTGFTFIVVDDSFININFFLLAIVVSIALTIILSSLRIRALEKLIFINNVLNNGNLYSIAFDQSGQIMYCSTNISQVFNTDSRFLVGKPISILNAYVVTQEMRESKIIEDFKDGKIFVIPFYNKLNEIRYLEWSCKKYGSNVNVLLGSDVTEKLQLSTNYQSIVEYADDIIYNTDINGNILFVNDKGARTFGYRSDNLIGKNSTHLVHPEYREDVIRFYANQFESKIHNTYHEFPLRSKDGRVIWVGQNVTMTFEPGSRKRISGFVALARDITEKRMNEMVIEQQTKDIKSNIDSARSIQENLLPKSAAFNAIFSENFVLYKPKEIVSGDFYFVYEKDGFKYFILGDCSGTGVSGAFFSILGVNLVKLILVERNITEPQDIMTMLIDEFEKVTPRNDASTSKKMLKCVILKRSKDDIKLCSNGLLTGHISKETVKLYRNTFSTKGDTHQVSIKYSELDVFYFSTDGYLNQIGGLKERTFGIKRMEELMVKINNESLQLQRKHFENALRNWKDNFEQTDDVTLIGIRCRD